LAFSRVGHTFVELVYVAYQANDDARTLRTRTWRSAT
jgi:hypothetical protein